MITEQTPMATRSSDDAHSPLSEIETLIKRARAGDISESSALSKISVLAREATAGDIYQKPWG